MYTAALALGLALAPSTSPPRSGFDVADAELSTTDNSTHLLAYDSDGEVAAEIVVWFDSGDRPRLDVMFADGLYLSAVDGEVETDDAAEVAARVGAIDDWLTAEPAAQGRSWPECGATVLAVCECLPLLSSGEAEC